jgi:hypothetical protein
MPLEGHSRPPPWPVPWSTMGASGRRFRQPPPRGGILVGNGRRPRLPMLDPHAVAMRRDLPLGLEDPAYMPPTPHELWVHLQRSARQPGVRIVWRQVSAAELEGWVREAPELGAVIERPPADEQRYDDAGRLAALWVLEHLEGYPEDVRLADVLWREVGKRHPELAELGLSTGQRTWAIGAAQRIWDAHHRA